MADAPKSDLDGKLDEIKAQLKSEPKPENPERDLKAKIMEWLKGHGFPFEMTVAAAFHKAEYFVEQSIYYFNHDDVPQEIDILATQMGPVGDQHKGMVDLKVVVECKSNPRLELPWVVFTAPTSDYHTGCADFFHLLSDTARIAYNMATNPDPNAAPDPNLAPDLLRFGERLGFGIRCAHIFGGKENETLAYNAIVKLAEASGSHYPDDNGTALIVLPVLAVRTPLFECWRGDDGQIELQERQHLMLHWQRPTESVPTRPYMTIHVVHESGVAAFAEKAVELYKWFRETRANDVLAATEITRIKREREAEAEKARELE